MEIKGMVHCMFEQSGTFKKQFEALGFHAEDYDILNDFGQTDHIIDLFVEIDKAYKDEHSIFDNVKKDDLIFAFFPCTYFNEMQMSYYDISTNNNTFKPYYERVQDAIERLKQRTLFHLTLYKLVYIVCKRGLRLIVENPATTPSYLIGTRNFPKPTIIDKDRSRRGDNFKKPTAYWFFGCEPTYGQSYQAPQGGVINVKRRLLANHKGATNKQRVLISPDYARNFICDFILGREQKGLTEPSLF